MRFLQPKRVKHTIILSSEESGAGQATAGECYCFASNGYSHQSGKFNWVPACDGRLQGSGQIEETPPDITAPEHAAVIEWFAFDHACEGASAHGCRTCYENAALVIETMRKEGMFKSCDPDETYGTKVARYKLLNPMALSFLNMVIVLAYHNTETLADIPDLDEKSGTLFSRSR